MPDYDYKEIYFLLSGQIVDVIEKLDKLSDFLKNAQREAEKLFIEGNDKDICDL